MKKSAICLLTAVLVFSLLSAVGCGKKEVTLESYTDAEGNLIYASKEANETVSRADSYAPELPGIFVRADGMITGANVEPFDTDQYNESGLREFVQTQLSEYNKNKTTITVAGTSYEVGGKDALKLNSLTIENDVAVLLLDYKSCADYLAFNCEDPSALKNGGEVFWIKTVAEAVKSGVRFPEMKKADGQKADAMDVKSAGFCYCLALDFGANIS